MEVLFGEKVGPLAPIEPETPEKSGRGRRLCAPKVFKISGRYHGSVRREVEKKSGLGIRHLSGGLGVLVYSTEPATGAFLFRPDILAQPSTSPTGWLHSAPKNPLCEVVIHSGQSLPRDLVYSPR